MRGGHGARTLQGETPVPNGTLTAAAHPGTSSQGTCTTQHAPGPSSKMPPGGDDDIITPESESDTSYGLSVSYVNASPGNNASRVVVRLQSRNPQSVSTGTSTANDDSGNQSNNESVNSDTLVKKSNPQMQFIKRSDSVEIKRGSNSPRNSYVGTCDSLTPRKQQLNDSNESSTPTSSSHSVESPTFERSPLLKPEQCTPPGGADVSITWTRGSKPFRIPSNASSITSPDACHTTTRRSPPQSLPVVPVTVRDVSCASAAYGDQEPNVSQGDRVAPNHHHRRLPDVSPPNSRPVLHSPLSPTACIQVMPRSGSIASQVSQFSVCSETGEKKRPKLSVVPIAIGNDSPYPISPLSCSTVDPIPGPSAQSSSADSCVPSTTSEESSQTPSSGSSAVSSPLLESDTLMQSATSPSATSDSASQLDSRGSTLDRPKLRKSADGNSVVVNGAVVDLSAINNNYVNNDDSPHKSDVPSRNTADRNKPERRNSGKSDRSAADSRTAPSERPTVRKVKQRKRRPKDNSSSGEVTPVRISYVNSTTDMDTPPLVNRTADTDRRRLSSRGSESTSPKFKQYGFIDTPEVLTNRDPTSPPQHGSKPGVHRQNSKDKTSKEHRRSSRHSSADKDKSRESSRERRKRSGSRDRNVHKLDNDVMTQRDRNKDSERKLDNAAFINGDAAGSRNNKHAERCSGKHQRDQLMTSSSHERRRKRRSTGDRTFPDSHTQGQGHKHSQTAPALNGYHDNTDGIVVIDNDDDVFTNNHSNEAVDNIHHYPRNKSRTNRHSVPTLDNNTMYLDR